jgi:hypothetical protein
MLRPGDSEPSPLFPGRVQGFRTWRLSLDRLSTPSLIGQGDTRWERDGRPTVASCLPPREFEPNHAPGERSPAGRCSCGLYASHPWSRDPNSDFMRVDGMGLEPEDVFGVIEAWGRIEVHDDGFRAEFARPIALFSRRDAAFDWKVPCERMAAAYRSELIPVGSVEELAEHYGRFYNCLDRGTVEQLVAPQDLAA